MKRNIILLLFAFAAALIGCSKNETPTETQPPTTTPIYSYQTYSCTGKDSKAKGVDSFSVFVENTSIIFWHYNYQANCVATVSASFYSKPDSLFITEQDTVLGAWTFCDCHFPISSRIDSLASGKYVLSVYKYFTYRIIDSLIYRDTLRIQ